MFQKAASFLKKAVSVVKKGATQFVVGGLLAAGSAADALAVPVMDFSTVSASVTAEIMPAITAALPIMGLILAAGVGVKLYKKFIK